MVGVIDPYVSRKVPIYNYRRIILSPYTTSTNVYISENDGASWTTTAIGLNSGSHLQASIRGSQIYGVGKLTGVSPRYTVNNGISYANAPSSSTITGFFAAWGGHYIYSQDITYVYKSLATSPASWTSINAISTGQIYGFAASVSGQHLFTANLTNGYMCYSNDYGANWSYTSNGARSYAVACSADGKYVYWTRHNTSSTNSIYKSTNYGASPTSKYVSATTAGIGHVACSASGQYVLAIQNLPSYVLFISNDYGETFTAKSVANPYISRSYSVSESGQYMVVGNSVSNGTIYYSSDFGNSWNTIVLDGSGGKPNIAYTIRAVSVCEVR